jgi:hypothetical protein
MFKPNVNCIKVEDVEQPVVEITSMYDGMNQITEFHYDIDEYGNRIEAKQGQGMTRRMKMKLPLMFSPDFWKRHSYSLEDVVDTLNCFPSIHLWQLAVLLGVQLSNSSVKLVFSTPPAMVFSSKSIVLTKITSQLKKFYSFPETNVLDTTYEEHVPPLPIHRIPTAEYQLWKSRTPKLKHQIKILTPNHIDFIFNWKNITMVPMWLEDNCIYMMRVVTEDIYYQSGKEYKSLATRPATFIYNGIKMFGLCEECAFFLPKY